MKLSDNFIPVFKHELNIASSNSDSWLNNISIYDNDFPDLDKKKIAIIGVVSEDSNFENNHIRNFLYSYTKKEYGLQVADLGNFLLEKDSPKVYEKLAFTLSELIAKDICPILIGYSQEITWSMYMAYEYLNKIINMVNIDSVIDFRINNQSDFNDNNYLYKILLKDPSYLFNLSNLAYQTHLTDNSVIKMMEDHHFDLYRLGVLREEIRNMEPVIRSADMLSFDISAIRQSDAPANNHPSPNGIFAEDACKLTRYAGLSDNLSSIGFFEYNSAYDNNFQTARLIAQMIWYFVDGYLHKNDEIYRRNDKTFLKYITSDSNNNYQIVFYKSKNTNRWWMEVPIEDKTKHYEDKQIIPCSYQDYQTATHGEIPERWWKALQKLI